MLVAVLLVAGDGRVSGAGRRATRNQRPATDEDSEDHSRGSHRAIMGRRLDFGGSPLDFEGSRLGFEGNRFDFEGSPRESITATVDSMYCAGDLMDGARD
ncbi:MAG TPA: hypothetical protein VNI54_10265 [Thermoanaerobaculia bacterium]|nr:hypothetical protein [Thermoanaerobaculia bacterium]